MPAPSAVVDRFPSRFPGLDGALVTYPCGCKRTLLVPAARAVDIPPLLRHGDPNPAAPQCPLSGPP